MKKQKLKEIRHGIDGGKVEDTTIGYFIKIKGMHMATFIKKKE